MLIDLVNALIKLNLKYIFFIIVLVKKNRITFKRKRLF